MREMKKQCAMIMTAGFFLLCAGTAFAGEETDSCPTTGTVFDTLVNKAYACRREYLDADVSIGHGVTTLKELCGTVLEKSAEEKEMILAMSDTAFFAMITQDSVRQTLKSKMNDDTKSTLNNLNGQLNTALAGLNKTLESATGIAKEIPEAITQLPSMFKGLNMRKIPTVKSALEKAKGWTDNVIENVPVSVEEVNTTVNAINGLIN